MPIKKRFIAGAVCPSCQKIDTLRWWAGAHVEVIECVGCGHSDRRLPQMSANKKKATEEDSSMVGLFKPR